MRTRAKKHGSRGGASKLRQVSIPDTTGEIKHVSILDAITLMKVSQIRPSPENNDLYGRLNPDHADDRALIEDIRNRPGVADPLAVTLDGYILSGHRRHAACRYLGIEEVPVRVVNVRHADAGYHALLMSYNRQRVKTIDEIMREELAVTDPEEAHRVLVEHRKQAAKVDVETFEIEGRKLRAAITDAKKPLLDAIRNVLNDRKDFWPLTDRQVHYALLNDPPLIHAKKPDSRYTNTSNAYQATCELITRARLVGLIPFQAIDDPTRPIVTWDVFREPTAFIRGQVDGFMKGYYRDLLQSQPNQIELVAEKNTVDNLIRPVAMEYCLPMTIGRGYSSLPPRKKMATRFHLSGKSRLVILMLGDFDPEGQDIVHSFARSMRDDFRIRAIEPIKVVLTPAQIEAMQLPPLMKAKDTSSRFGKFVERHGDDVFELEAVPPLELQEILRKAIDSVLDLGAFNGEVDAEKRDAAQLAGIRRILQKSFGTAPLEGVR